MLLLLAGCLTVVGSGLPAIVLGAAVKDVLNRPALKVEDPAQSVLIDVARADRRLVAVGERGIIIYSDDAGDTWHQADVPVSATLTAIAFPTAEQGWAVGHSGVVLHTTDSGQTWRRKLDGAAAARMALESARGVVARSKLQEKTARRMVRNAELLVADGPDKPFLDLYFKNERDGIVVGSYGLIFSTPDGGETWNCLMDRLDNPGGLNLYAIRGFDNTIYISGEQGLFYISGDNGRSFDKIKTPYAGTYFDLSVTSSGHVVIVGLRGNAYWSTNPVDTFKPTQVPVPVSFTAAGQLDKGTMIFANQAGMLLESQDQGRTMQVIQVPRMAPISSFIPIGDGHLLTVGFGGVARVQLPSSDSITRGGQQ
jgi:photosystem II stability/assembly factor-like uncharacterized protein